MRTQKIQLKNGKIIEIPKDQSFREFARQGEKFDISSFKPKIKKMEKKYDVEIVEIATGKIEAIIGKDLSEEQAEKRIEAGLQKINTENYFVVRKVEV